MTHYYETEENLNICVWRYVVINRNKIGPKGTKIETLEGSSSVEM